MEKYIIIWDAGYGDNAEVVEAENIEAASKMAYEAWREDSENNADYKAVKYNCDTAYDYGVQDDDCED